MCLLLVFNWMTSNQGTYTVGLRCGYNRSRDQDCKMPTLLLQTEQLSCKLVYLCHLYFGYFGLVFAAVFQPKLINLSLPAYNGLHSQNAALIYIVSVCPIIAQCTIAPEVSNVILVMCCECFSISCSLVDVQNGLPVFLGLRHRQLCPRHIHECELVHSRVHDILGSHCYIMTVGARGQTS